MKKTVLITGGNGFIGKRLTDALLQEGYKVRILSRRAARVQPVNPDVEVVQADYHDPLALRQALQGCFRVYHLAAAIFGFHYEDFKQANTVVTANLVAAANETDGLEQFIYMSSLAASGFAKEVAHPRVETDTPAPISDYGRTKQEGEQAVAKLRPNITWTIIRAPIVYGGSDSGVSKIASWVKRGLMVNTSGDGLFSFVHVDDLVKALVTAPKLAAAAGQIFFVCEEKQYTWDYFISQMAKAMGVRKPFMPKAPVWLMQVAAAIYTLTARITGVQPALNYDKVREAVIDGHWICSGAKWQQISGQNFTPLAEGLAKSFKANAQDN